MVMVTTFQMVSVVIAILYFHTSVALEKNKKFGILVPDEIHSLNISAINMLSCNLTFTKNCSSTFERIENHRVRNTLHRPKLNIYEESLRNQTAWIDSNIVHHGGFIVASIGFISNILVILVVTRIKTLKRKSAGILMISLACTDSIYLLSRIVEDIGREGIYVKIHRPYCVIYYYLLPVMRSTSNLIVLMTGINRYALICHPFSHSVVTSIKGAVIQILISLTLAAFGNMYLIFTFSPHNATCVIDEKIHFGKSDISVFHFGFVAFTMLFFNVVPYIVTLILSVLVVRSSRHRFGIANLIKTSRQIKRNIRHEKQLTRAMISVIVAFVVLSAPYVTTQAIHAAYAVKGNHTSIQNNYWNLQAMIILSLFRDLNYGIHFFLYYIFCKIFRDTFKYSLLLKKQVNNVNSTRQTLSSV